MGGGILAFDSGIGGLSIVRALQAVLPGTRIDYLADNAVFPYGELPDDVLIDRVVGLIGDAIEGLRPELVVVACNTASTMALDALRDRFALPFVGCVPPIKWAAETSLTRHIGLLATAATVRRPYLHDLQARFAPDCRLVAHGARSLADIAEMAFRQHPIDQDAVRRELDQLLGQPGGALVDVICIGCTHYSILLDALRAASTRPIVWLDPAAAVARRAASLLAGRAAAGSGSAWFTAPVHDEARVVEGLAAFGYDGIRHFEAANTARLELDRLPQRPRLTV